VSTKIFHACKNTRSLSASPGHTNKIGLRLFLVENRRRANRDDRIQYEFLPSPFAAPRPRTHGISAQAVIRKNPGPRPGPSYKAGTGRVLLLALPLDSCRRGAAITERGKTLGRHVLDKEKKRRREGEKYGRRTSIGRRKSRWPFDALRNSAPNAPTLLV
jgi:hypothetical protein